MVEWTWLQNDIGRSWFCIGFAHPYQSKTAYREFQSSECDNWPPEKHVFFVVEVIWVVKWWKLKMCFKRPYSKIKLDQWTIYPKVLTEMIQERLFWIIVVLCNNWLLLMILTLFTFVHKIFFIWYWKP